MILELQCILQTREEIFYNAIFNRKILQNKLKLKIKEIPSQTKIFTS